MTSFSRSFLADPSHDDAAPDPLRDHLALEATSFVSCAGWLGGPVRRSHAEHLVKGVRAGGHPGLVMRSRLDRITGRRAKAG